MILELPVALIIAGSLALMGAIALTVVLAVLGKKGKIKGFLSFLDRIFDFKDLILEKIIKFLYMFATFGSIIGGFFLLFGYTEHYHHSYNYGYYSYYEKESTALLGVILIVLGPIAVRIAFEILTMFVLLVKNTIAINNKLANQNANAPAAVINPAVPAAPAYTAPSADPVFTQADSAAVSQPVAAEPVPEFFFCPQCGNQCKKGETFCGKCGLPLKF